MHTFVPSYNKFYYKNDDFLNIHCWIMRINGVIAVRTIDLFLHIATASLFAVIAMIDVATFAGLNTFSLYVLKNVLIKKLLVFLVKHLSFKRFSAFVPD